MGSLIEAILEIGLFVFFFRLFLNIAAYLIEGFIINSVHKRMYGKDTIMAWIPILQDYVLGKIVANQTVGFIFVFLPLFAFLFVRNFESFTRLYDFVRFIFLIIAIIKFFTVANSSNKKIKTGTKYCPNCGAVQDNGSEYCTNCGKNIKK